MRLRLRLELRLQREVELGLRFEWTAAEVKAFHTQVSSK